MRLFAPMYERALQWSRHPRAPTLLGALSFFEAVFFPVPPEVMLAPMSLAQPKRGWYFASISLLWSTLGALLGYAIGHLAFDLVAPLIEQLGYGPRFEQIKEIARKDGFWFLLIGGFVPVPFKLLTLASGVVGMPLLPFLAGAIIGRGKRVFLVAGAIYWGGERAERMLHKYAEPVGWAVLALVVIIVVAIKFWHGANS